MSANAIGSDDLNGLVEDLKTSYLEGGNVTEELIKLRATLNTISDNTRQQLIDLGVRPEDVDKVTAALKREAIAKKKSTDAQ